MENYQIQLIPLAIKLLGKIKDQREQTLLTKKIEQLKQEPEKQGKPLSGKLKGYRSVRAVGQRYRIIYRVDKEQIIVIIIGVGIRKDGSKEDIYNYLKKVFDLSKDDRNQ
ncbi:MAG: type II toxin-antitoxin system mRNA interferase toxin, RelE/StbE family [Snowella sp.]|nr:type II toxin-antitoxin system mRNA interferase toxin, RelE/StbE family [Snowella sp.]